FPSGNEYIGLRAPPVPHPGGVAVPARRAKMRTKMAFRRNGCDSEILNFRETTRGMAASGMATSANDERVLHVLVRLGYDNQVTAIAVAFLLPLIIAVG